MVDALDVDVHTLNELAAGSLVPVAPRTWASPDSAIDDPKSTSCGGISLPAKRVEGWAGILQEKRFGGWSAAKEAVGLVRNWERFLIRLILVDPCAVLLPL
jgi:hypothetical protein